MRETKGGTSEHIGPFGEAHLYLVVHSLDAAIDQAVRCESLETVALLRDAARAVHRVCRVVGLPMREDEEP